MYDTKPAAEKQTISISIISENLGFFP